MNASDVIQFLQANPEFFDDNSTLLTDLTVTHPHNGQAISLTERQLIALRERIARRVAHQRQLNIVRRQRPVRACHRPPALSHAPEW